MYRYYVYIVRMYLGSRSTSSTMYSAALAWSPTEIESIHRYLPAVEHSRAVCSEHYRAGRKCVLYASRDSP